MSFERVLNERINTVTRISVKLKKNENRVNNPEIMFFVSFETKETILVLFVFLGNYVTMGTCNFAVYSLLNASSSSR